jgi:hypothetical protein
MTPTNNIVRTREIAINAKFPHGPNELKKSIIILSTVHTLATGKSELVFKNVATFILH